MEAKRDHWESVYQSKAADQVSWYAPHLTTSLKLIQRAAIDKHAAIIDVGGGEATLVDDLLAEGYERVSVLDLSQTAIDVARQRLGAQADQVGWYCADVTTATLPQQYFDVWHDRAVFHFLTTREEREAYVNAVLRAVKPGGHVIVATFAEDGPEKCSGLPVMRYSADGLHAEFGAPFTLLQQEREEHHTPSGTVQKFIYCLCRKESS